MVPLRPNEMGLLQLFNYNFGQAFRDPLDLRISRQPARPALRNGRLYPRPSHQKIFLVLISVVGCFDPRALVRPERLCQWKIPVTSSGIEPATFWLVTQSLNQLRHRVTPAVRASRIRLDSLSLQHRGGSGVSNRTHKAQLAAAYVSQFYEYIVVTAFPFLCFTLSSNVSRRLLQLVISRARSKCRLCLKFAQAPCCFCW
jgi:hypothetical protein